MDIKLGDNKFYIGDDPDKPLASITFVPKDDNIIVVDHTNIYADSLKGQGVGLKLVEHIVAFARREKLKIIPECPYAKKVLTGSPIYQDVLA